MSSQRAFSPYSISRRLTISLVCMVALVASGITLALYLETNAQLERELLQRADEISRHLVDALEMPLWDWNTQNIAALSDAFARNAIVASLIVTARSGEILHASENDRLAVWIERTHPIQHHGEPLGEVRLKFTKQPVQQTQRALLRALMTTAALILLALSVGSGLLVRIFLRQPLQRLNTIVNAYAAGKYDALDDASLPYLEFQSFGDVLQRMGATISEQMRRLQESEERYRKAQAIGHVGNWEYHLHTTHFWGSDEAKRIYGFDPAQADFSTDAVENCIPERQRVHQALIDLIETDTPYHLEFEIHPRDCSEPKIIASLAELVRDERGAPVKVVGVIQDITARKRVEHALRESEERFRFVLENSLDAAYRRNLQTDYYDYMSPAIKHVLGWSVEEMNSMDTETVLRLIHPDDVPGIARELTRTNAQCQTAGRATGKLEYRLRDKQGVYRWVGDAITVLADAKGAPLYRLGIARDITERKLAEEKLLQYQRIVSSTPDGIALLDRAYHYLIVNDSYERFFGVSRDTFSGKSIAEYLGEETFQREVQPRFEQCLQGETVRYRNWHHYPTLGQRFVEMTYSPYRDARQEIIGLVSNIRDITESKQAEDALEQERQRLFAVLEMLPVFVYLQAKDYSIPFVNRVFRELFGEPANRPCYQVLQKREAPCEPCLTFRVFETKQPEQWEWNDGRTGRTYMLHDLLFPGVEEEFVLEVGIDITDRKRAEEQLKNQNLLLEEAVQQKQREMEALFEKLIRQEKLATIGKITGSIAHELRNPLGAIKQAVYYLKLLAQRQQLTTDNPKVLRHLEIMDTELEMSERVIADLLEITRMKQPKRQAVNLRTLCADAITRCNLPPCVRVTIMLPPDPFEIYADPFQMRQVFLNVLTNAAQAIDGEGAISIEATPLPDQGEVAITIHDTGVGIPPEALQSVFEPLYTTKATGTGLGLPICKEIIENHQGRISLTSQSGEGTTITILLPQHETFI